MRRSPLAMSWICFLPSLVDLAATGVWYAGILVAPVRVDQRTERRSGRHNTKTWLLHQFRVIRPHQTGPANQTDDFSRRLREAHRQMVDLVTREDIQDLCQIIRVPHE